MTFQHQAADKKPPPPLRDRLRPGCKPRWRLIPTLRCNLACSYCSADVRRGYPCTGREIRPVQWIKIIRQIASPYVITGGEPFLYPNLANVICKANAQRVRINTNLLLMTEEDMAALHKRGNVVLRVTLHFGQPGWRFSTPETLDKLEMLLGYDRIKTMFLTIGAPEAKTDIAAFGAAGVNLTVIRDARSFDRFHFAETRPPRVLCTRKARLIGPGGRRHPCFLHLRRGTLPMALHAPPVFSVLCGNYGDCSHCDRHCHIIPVADEAQPEVRDATHCEEAAS